MNNSVRVLDLINHVNHKEKEQLQVNPDQHMDLVVHSEWKNKI